jgi:hypothetical protein
VLEHKGFRKLLLKRKEGPPNIVRLTLFLVPLSRPFLTFNGFLLLRLTVLRPYLGVWRSCGARHIVYY